MDGHNACLDNFLLVIWVFLDVCPEAPAINPFSEAKQTHRERGKKPEATDVPPRGAWLTGKTSGPREERNSVKRELSSKPFSESHSLLLWQGNEPALSVFLSGTPDKAKESPTQDSTISRKSCHLLQ